MIEWPYANVSCKKKKFSNYELALGIIFFLFEVHSKTRQDQRIMDDLFLSLEVGLFLLIQVIGEQ